MITFIRSTIFAIVIVTWCCAEAAAEKRVALIIGNAAHSASAGALRNPTNDASDVTAALRRLDFETIVGTDLDKVGMEEIAIRFARASRDADVALFYYSGHALQHLGSNYLVPVDGKLDDEADLRRLTKVEDLMADLQQAKNLRIMVLDACRNNPLAERLQRSLGATRAASFQRGLAKLDSPVGMIISYATQAGKTAADGDGRNSPYTKAFLEHIETSEEIGTIFRRISSSVYSETKQTQLPELSLSLISEIYFKQRAGVARPASTPIPPPMATQKPVTTAAAAPAKETVSQPDRVDLTYAPWTKFCLKGKEANAKNACFTGKDGRIQSGQPVVAAVLIEPEGDPKKILRVTLPLGMQLVHGTRIIIDSNPPIMKPYVICFQNGCMSDYDATPELIANLKNGQSLIIQAINSNGKPLTLPLPLKNGEFARAFEGPPTDQKVFEAQQKRIEEEIKARGKTAKK